MMVVNGVLHPIRQMDDISNKMKVSSHLLLNQMSSIKLYSERL